MKKAIDKIAATGENRVVSLVRFFAFLLSPPGIALIFRNVVKYLKSKGLFKRSPLKYELWLQKTQPLSEEEVQGCLSKIAIVIHSNDLNSRALSGTIASIKAERHQNIEIFVVSPFEAGILDKDFETGLNMIHGGIDPANGLNQAVAKTNAAFVLFLRSGDILREGALSSFVRGLTNRPDVSLIYADDDIIDENGKLSNPFFKPDFAPDSLLSQNYVGSDFLVSRTAFLTLGGFRPGFNGQTFYDFLLRVSEVNTPIHLQKMLIHKPNPIEMDVNENKLAKGAVESALLRRNTPGQVTNNPFKMGCFDIYYPVIKYEKVSIIIPSKDQTEYLVRAIQSVFELTIYPDFEVIVIDNNSTDQAFFDAVKKLKSEHPDRFRCIKSHIPFNFSRLMNLGRKHAKGAYLLLLNNDVEVLSQEWLARMVGSAQLPHIGAVGCKLLYPGGKIQHAGIILGGDELTSHIFAGKGKNELCNSNIINTTNNFCALTAACMMVRSSVFDEVGGMDEVLDVEYNDVDLCLKLLSKGYYNVYLPTVELVHYESITRGHPFRSWRSWRKHTENKEYFLKKWSNYIKNDPFWNNANNLEFVVD